MCKNEATLLYSYILLDLPSLFFCQRNMEEKGGRDGREGKNEERFAGKNIEIRFPVWRWLENRPDFGL